MTVYNDPLSLDLSMFYSASPVRQVWVRSKRVSYSKVLPVCVLRADHTIALAEFAEFTWEPWP